jgi:hypothetical protein
MAERVLADERYDVLRGTAARRTLVAAFLVALALLPVAFSVGSLPGLLGVAVAGGLWIALRISVRVVADLPDEVLDERQRALRDQAYVRAYRWLSGFVVLLGSSALIAFIVLGQDPDTWRVTIAWDQAMALFWVALGLTLALPSISLAFDRRA